MSGGEDNIQGYMLAIQQLRLCSFFFFKDLGNASLAATLVIIHVIAYNVGYCIFQLSLVKKEH